MSFSEYKLGELYEISSGLSKGGDEFGFGYPFLTFKDVFNNYFVPEHLNEFANTNDNERLRNSIRRGDVFLTRTSESINELGMSSVALKDYVDATFNGFTKRLRPLKDDLVLPEYAGFYFRSQKFRTQVNSMSIMTTRASLNNSMIEKLTMILPDMKEQIRIANVLMPLLYKIETNNNIIKNLEEIEQAVFKRWFIDYQFPNEDGRSYKSNGGIMKDSIIGMIPNSWSVVQLGDVTSNIRDRTKSNDFRVLSAVSTGNLKLSEEYFTKQVFSKDLTKYIIVKQNEFAYNPARVNIGSIGMNEYDFDGCVSPVYVVFKAEENYHWFFKLYIKTDNFKNEVKKRASGSVRQALNYRDFELIKTIYPTVDVVKKFNLFFEACYYTEKQLAKETEILTITIETLLPKLISGEIRVPIEEVV